MIRIAILEDDKDMLMEIRRYLERYESENPVRWSISLFTDENKLFLDCRYCSDYQVIMIDMDQRKEEKFEAVSRIRETSRNSAIILLSSSEDIFREGYQVEAAGCLIKPATYQKFSEVLQTVLEPLEDAGEKSLLLPVSDGLRKIPESRILYMEKSGDSLVCHTQDEIFSAEEEFEKMRARLTGNVYFWCGRTYLINLENVDGIQENEIRLGSSRLPVSASESQEALGALNCYLSEVGI